MWLDSCVSLLGSDVIVHGVALGWLLVGVGVEVNFKICVALPNQDPDCKSRGCQKSHVRFDVDQDGKVPGKDHNGKDKVRSFTFPCNR